MQTTTITPEIAAKVLRTVDKGLSSGLGTRKPGQMCVEAAVCYALGLPHGDEPPCVAPALRSLKIRLNDANWSSKTARARGLRRLAIAQLGSESLDQVEFVKRVALLTVNKAVPIALRAAASLHPNEKHKQSLEQAALNCEQAQDNAAANAANAARAAAYAADDAARAVANVAANAANAANVANVAADAAARAVSHAAADAAYVAARAANVAADAVARAVADVVDAVARTVARTVARAAADAAARDKVLADYAEAVVQILIEMNAPGCEFLGLAPL